MARIYQSIQASAGTDVKDTWQDKINGMLCPKGFEAWYEQVHRIGIEMMKQYPFGWRLHGDLQFGNILVRTEYPGTILLIDWEMSEVMPFGYEFAMLYGFLIDPDGQVDPPLREAYRQQTPLRKLWRRVSSGLCNQFGLEPDEIENMILFRMGNAWLYQLANAIENQNFQRAEELELQLDRLLNGHYFADLPIIECFNQD